MPGPLTEERPKKNGGCRFVYNKYFSILLLFCLESKITFWRYFVISRSFIVHDSLVTFHDNFSYLKEHKSFKYGLYRCSYYFVHVVYIKVIHSVNKVSTILVNMRIWCNIRKYFITHYKYAGIGQYNMNFWYVHMFFHIYGSNTEILEKEEWKTGITV